MSSLYRSLGKVQINDVYAERVRSPGATRSPTGAPHDRVAEEALWRGKRRSQPANIALPRTRAWADSMPPRIQLAALMRTFPRIANMLAATWNDRAASSAYLEELMVDRRGDRQGFPSEVRAELLELRAYHTGLEPVLADAWHNINKRK